MENINENPNEETSSLLSSLSSIYEDANDLVNNELIYNGYTCKNCNSIPEIINIDFIKNTLEIKCQNHQNEITWDEFIIDTLKYNYNFAVCNICLETIQKNNSNIFKYCYDCNKVICDKCYINHNSSHYLINYNQYNNKCNIHFNQTYTSFCNDCKVNICNECKKSKIHMGHRKYDFIEIEPTEDEIEQIKDFCSKFKNNLKLIEKSGKKEIEEIEYSKNKWLQIIK